MLCVAHSLGGWSGVKGPDLKVDHNHGDGLKNGIGADAILLPAAETSLGAS